MSSISATTLVVYIIIWLVSGIISAFIASSKKQATLGFFFIGILLGPLGILVAILGISKESISSEELEKYPPVKPDYIMNLACINVLIISIIYAAKFLCLPYFISPVIINLYEQMGVKLPGVTIFIMVFAKVFRNPMLQAFAGGLWTVLVILYFRWVKSLEIKKGPQKALETQILISFLSIILLFIALFVILNFSILFPLSQLPFSLR